MKLKDFIDKVYNTVQLKYVTKCSLRINFIVKKHQDYLITCIEKNVFIFLERNNNGIIDVTYTCLYHYYMLKVTYLLSSCHRR